MLSHVIAAVLPVVPKSVIGRVARRYIAGDSRSQAIALLRTLGVHGFVSTVDVLGEDTTSMEQATRAASEYVDLIRDLAESGVERNVSLKLSQFGLRLDEAGAFAELRRVLDVAAENDTFVRIDMEDSSVTDLTLDFYRRAREVWPRVGTVVQARLRRTVLDVEQLAKEGANLRLCKGIYKEPKALAHLDREAIREAYLDAARILLQEPSTYTGLATHDLPLTERVLREIDKRPHCSNRYEFQALIGVPIRTHLLRLRQRNIKVRLYVPYGADWYAYSVRRLKENPDMALDIARGLLSPDRMDSSTI
jgi:proline dehydrogenase